MIEKLWTVDGLGLPQDFALNGIMQLKDGRIHLEPGSAFTDHGDYAEIRYTGDNSDIIVQLIPQKTGISLWFARSVNRTAGLIDKLYSRYMGNR